MNFLIFLTAFSAVFLNRFGLNVIGDFSLSFSFIFLYLTLSFGVIKGLLFVNFKTLYLFLGVVFAACISYMYGKEFKSFPSFLLFLFVYFPFIFEKKSASSSSDGFLRLFYPLFLIVATAGIAQFFLQFFYKPDWLFDYRPFLPDLVRNKNPMNTVIPFAGFIKSNGFFLLEPSGFSQMMSFGLYFCTISPYSFLSFFIFFTGLIVSFSGTGFILQLS